MSKKTRWGLEALLVALLLWVFVTWRASDEQLVSFLAFDLFASWPQAIFVGCMVWLLSSFGRHIFAITICVFLMFPVGLYWVQSSGREQLFRSIPFFALWAVVIAELIYGLKFRRCEIGGEQRWLVARSRLRRTFLIILTVFSASILCLILVLSYRHPLSPDYRFLGGQDQVEHGYDRLPMGRVSYAVYSWKAPFSATVNKVKAEMSSRGIEVFGEYNNSKLGRTTVWASSDTYIEIRNLRYDRTSTLWQQGDARGPVDDDWTTVIIYKDLEKSLLVEARLLWQEFRTAASSSQLPE